MMVSNSMGVNLALPELECIDSVLELTGVDE